MATDTKVLEQAAALIKHETGLFNKNRIHFTPMMKAACTLLTALDEALDRITELEGIIDAGADRGDFLYEQHKDRLLEKDDD